MQKYKYNISWHAFKNIITVTLCFSILLYNLNDNPSRLYVALIGKVHIISPNSHHFAKEHCVHVLWNNVWKKCSGLPLKPPMSRPIAVVVWDFSLKIRLHTHISAHAHKNLLYQPKTFITKTRFYKQIFGVNKVDLRRTGIYLVFKQRLYDRKCI